MQYIQTDAKRRPQYRHTNKGKTFESLAPVANLHRYTIFEYRNGKSGTLSVAKKLPPQEK
jgi:hypothetical protein